MVAGITSRRLLAKLLLRIFQASPKLSKLKPEGKSHMWFRLTSLKFFIPVVTNK
jgi:hypothetical protein